MSYFVFVDWYLSVNFSGLITSFGEERDAFSAIDNS